MNFNKSIIEDIISENFIGIIQDECNSYITDLNSEDIDNLFDNFIDYIDIDSIGDLNIINYSINKLDDETEISGTYEINIDVNGYAHWDKENFFLESSELKLIMDFVFYEESESKFSDFEITEIYF